MKRLFDPEFLLNPGVILNEDPDVHAKNIRHDGLASPLVDRCISCGWCESNCPSRDLTLTPRQRIQVCKEMTTNPLPPYPHPHPIPTPIPILNPNPHQVYKEMTKMRDAWEASGERHKPARLLAFEVTLTRTLTLTLT